MRGEVCLTPVVIGFIKNYNLTRDFDITCYTCSVISISRQLLDRSNFNNRCRPITDGDLNSVKWWPLDLALSRERFIIAWRTAGVRTYRTSLLRKPLRRYSACCGRGLNIQRLRPTVPVNLHLGALDSAS